LTFDFDTFQFETFNKGPSTLKLYLFRHAPAQERHVFAQTDQPDEFRPITEKGAQRMRDVLNFFRKKESHIDLILQSPLLRCQETGDIIQEFYPQAELLTTEHLKPSHSAQKLYNKISQNFHLDSLALVGHEPDLGQFISWLLLGQSSDHFPLKKAGVAKLDIYKDGRRYLKWVLRPSLITNK
jgi:phosphohistidine phosphatase